MFTPTLNNTREISTRVLKKYNYFKKGGYKSGIITWSRNGEEVASIGATVGEENEKVSFNYTTADRQTGEATDKRYSVKLVTTPCNYGGVRYWFECPFCKKRMGTLYLYEKNDFACRKCLNLPYKSQNNSGVERAVGECMNYPQLEEFRAKIRPYYNGKMTRNYKRYIKHHNKLINGMMYFNTRMEAQLKRLNKKYPKQ